MDSLSWLLVSYVENVLRAYYGDSKLKVHNFAVAPALGKGENFGGILTRANVDFQTQTGQMKQQNLIIKSSFEGDEFSKSKMAPYDIFNREISIYATVLPKINQLLRDINDDEQLFATTIHTDYEKQVLIFEDLSERGYVMADRINGLDMKHVQLLLRKLAKMHAASAVMNEHENGALEAYDRGFFNRYTDNYSSYFVCGLVACANFLKKWPDHHYYSRKLMALEPHYMEIGKRCFAPTPGHVNVLAHGDMWTNNIMYKYDTKTGEPIDVLIIDFQYTFWGSPTLDLHHFFNTSMQEDLRLQQQDVLLKFYHEIFTETLRKLNYKSLPIPSLRLFRLHAESKRFFAFHSSCVVQPVMINEDAEDADFVALMSEDERGLNFKSRLYNNQRVQQTLRNLLPFFDRKGILEVNQAA